MVRGSRNRAVEAFDPPLTSTNRAELDSGARRTVRSEAWAAPGKATTLPATAETARPAKAFLKEIDAGMVASPELSMFGLPARR
jgi:hypothetical protein